MKVLREMPYKISSWYRAVRGIDAPTCAVEFDESFDANAAAEAWQATPAGEALVLVLRSDGGLFARMLANRGRTSPLKSWVRALGDDVEVEHSLVFPATGGSCVLIDAAPARAFRAGTRMLPAGRRRWKILRMLLGHLARLGLHERLGLDELWVLRKREVNVGADAASVREHMALSSGVPGLFQTTVAQLCGEDGTIRAYVKIATGAEALDSVRWEGEVLKRLAGLKIRTAAIPTLLSANFEKGAGHLTQQALTGARSPDELRRAHLDFLAELQAQTHSRQRLDSCSDYLRACRQLEEVRSCTDETWLELMQRMQSTLRVCLAGRVIPCCLAHGDFTPWNTTLDEGRLGVFDWEYARFEAVALHDIFHFIIQTEVLVVHATNVLNDKQSTRLILARIREVIEGSASELRDRVQASGCDWPELLLLYLFDITTRDEWLNSKERPPFEQVEWLRSARMDLARALLERLDACPVPPVAMEAA